MPRKQRTPKPRVDVPLTPAWIWALMTGTRVTARLPGWVDQAQESDAARGQRIWAQHGPALTAEAAAAGFQPFWAQKRRPTGEGFTAWRAGFLVTHSY